VLVPTNPLRCLSGGFTGKKKRAVGGVGKGSGYLLFRDVICIAEVAKLGSLTADNCMRGEEASNKGGEESRFLRRTNNAEQLDMGS